MTTNTVIYSVDGLECHGYVAYPENVGDKTPAVMISHDWTGRNEFACKKAEQLAAMGYVGFALDLYGKAALGKNNDEKAHLMKPLMEDRLLLQQRMLGAFETVQDLPEVDASRVAAIGYCFGGLCVLDLARSGASLRGVVSFHGLLTAPSHSNKKISASILALHGDQDPMVPRDQVLQFEKEMTEKAADWQLHIYGHTLHAFTNPLAHDAAFGTVYNARADARSWKSCASFLKECFQE